METPEKNLTTEEALRKLIKADMPASEEEGKAMGDRMVDLIIDLIAERSEEKAEERVDQHERDYDHNN